MKIGSYIGLFSALVKCLGIHGMAYSKEFRRPNIIAHRGAAGMYPEHTALAYHKAFDQGADYIECDVTVTKDLQLVCSHEPWILNMTNVVCNFPGEKICGPPHENFNDRLNTYNMDDHDPDFAWNDHGYHTDYFTYDFTLEELKTLRRKQFYEFRDPMYNWKFSFVTFQEYMDMARNLGFGIYPEIKHGYATNQILMERNETVTLEDLIFEALEDNGYHDAGDNCVIQSFELPSLQAMRELGSDLRQCFLCSNKAAMTDDFLDHLQSENIFTLGLNKALIVQGNDSNHIISTSKELINKIHDRDMEVTLYTFRNEYDFLFFDYGQDPYEEYQLFYDMGIDGFFTEFPLSLKRFLEWKEEEHQMVTTTTAQSTTASTAATNFPSGLDLMLPLSSCLFIKLLSAHFHLRLSSLS